MQEQGRILQMLLKRQPPLVYKPIFDWIDKCKKQGHAVWFFEIRSVLTVLNAILQTYNLSVQKDSTPEDERALLFSILVTNEKVNSQQAINSSDKFDRFCEITWPLMIQGTELRIKRNILTYLHRSLGLLTFFNRNDHYRMAFNEWKWLENKDTLKDYLYKVLELYVNGFRKDLKNFSYKFSLDMLSNNPLVEQILLDIRESGPANFKETDYQTLRSKPILRLKDDEYTVVNWNFVIEKLFGGLLFDIFNNTSLHKSYLDKNGKPRFDEFKGEIGFHFTESYFYSILKVITNARPYVILQGDPNNANNADYFLRKGKHVCLIEFKDALSVKHDNYNAIKKQIDDKIGGEKGVGQIQKLIYKFENNPDDFEPGLSKKYKKKKLILYPILVVSDTSFALSGMSDYLNREFRKNLKKTSFFIRDLIVIDVEFFLAHYDDFVSYRADIITVLNKYYGYKFQLRRFARKRYASLDDISQQYNSISELDLFKRRSNNKKRNKRPNTLYSTILSQIEEFGKNGN